MIKTGAQRSRTIVQIDGFRQALAAAAKNSSGKRAAAIAGSYEGMIQQLQEEVEEYDQIKSSGFDLPEIDRLDAIAPFIVKLRIARHVSQTELARRLGVSKQVVSRYEEDEYQNAGISRVQEILDALGVTIRVTLTA